MRRYFIALLSVLFIGMLQAQSSSNIKFIIPFESKLIATNLGMNVQEDFDWNIINLEDKALVSKGSGASIFQYIFSNPGNYQVTLEHNAKHIANGCDHGHDPIKVNFSVSPVRMIFDFSKIKFSSKIEKGKSVNGIKVTVPIMVTSVNQQTFRFSPKEVLVTGIGCNITATSMQTEIELKEGENILTYNLKGIANEEAFLMFDFVDANNNVQSYSQTEPIK
jgi:hypothetical protein